MAKKTTSRVQAERAQRARRKTAKTEPKKVEPKVVPLLEAGFRLLGRRGVANRSCPMARLFSVFLRRCLAKGVIKDIDVWNAMPSNVRQALRNQFTSEPMPEKARPTEQRLQRLQELQQSYRKGSSLDAVFANALDEQIAQAKTELATLRPPLMPQFTCKRDMYNEERLQMAWVPVADVPVDVPEVPATNPDPDEDSDSEEEE